MVGFYPTIFGSSRILAFRLLRPATHPHTCPHTRILVTLVAAFCTRVDTVLTQPQVGAHPPQHPFTLPNYLPRVYAGYSIHAAFFNTKPCVLFFTFFYALTFLHRWRTRGCPSPPVYHWTRFPVLPLHRCILYYILYTVYGRRDTTTAITAPTPGLPPAP